MEGTDSIVGQVQLPEGKSLGEALQGRYSVAFQLQHLKSGVAVKLFYLHDQVVAEVQTAQGSQRHCRQESYLVARKVHTLKVGEILIVREELRLTQKIKRDIQLVHEHQSLEVGDLSELVATQVYFSKSKGNCT